jgi:hypothetical protein
MGGKVMAGPARRGRTDSPLRPDFAEPRHTSGETRDQIRVLNPTLRNGFAQVPSPLMRARGLSHQAVRLYGLLLDYSWSDNACFPGQARLAADLDLKSVRSVYTILSELRDYGLIDWHRRPNNSNVYLLLDFTQDPRIAIRRTPDGKPYLERIKLDGDAGASHPDWKKTASPINDADRQCSASPESPDRTSAADPDRQCSADEEYPVEAYSDKNSDSESPSLNQSGIVGRLPSAISEERIVSLIGGIGLASIWASALDELRGRLSDANYRNWVLSARLVGVEDEHLVIAANSSFARDWLEERLADDIARAIARITGTWPELRFVVQRGEDRKR